MRQAPDHQHDAGRAQRLGLIDSATIIVTRFDPVRGFDNVGQLDEPRTLGPGNANGRQHNDRHHVTVMIGPGVKGSVIGGNCWITSSVPPDTVVMSEQAQRKHK